LAGISLQERIIYGPTFSRRLGRSLGINILPAEKKLCSYDCIYCQYGHTDRQFESVPSEMMPSVDVILTAIEKALKKPRTINYLTFSGNGEPTMHPDFHEIIQGTRELVNKFRPEVKIALFSNASLLSQPDVIKALGLIDLPMMKLDAGDEQTFQAINQPVKKIKLDGIIRDLKSIPSLTIQTMLIDGEVNNITGDSYTQWVETVSGLNPNSVHIYSIERPTTCDSIKCVSPEQLNNIQEHLQDKLNSKVTAYWRN